MKYTFKQEIPYNFDFAGSTTEKTVTFETRSASLEGLIKDFEDFLRGSGFVFDGRLELVRDEVHDEAEHYNLRPVPDNT